MKKYLFPILSLLVLVGGAIYFFQNKSEIYKPSFLVEKEILKDCPYDQEVCQFFVAQAKAMENGVTISTTTYSEENPEMNAYRSEVKMDGRGNMETHSYKGDELESSMIILDEQWYSKNPGDEFWLKMPKMDQDVPTTDDITDETTDDEQDIEDFYDESLYSAITKKGTEACGNKTCDIYEMEMGDEDGLVSTIWVEQKENLLYKSEILEDGQRIEYLYSYGPVEIKVPSPVKEMESYPVINEAPDYSNLPDSMGDDGEMPSAEELQKIMEQYQQ